MYSFLVESRVLPDTDYQFFTYDGKAPVEVSFRGRSLSIAKGTRFGVRPSSSGKQIRLIFPNDPTRVITIDLETAKRLANGIRSASKGKR